MTAAIEISPAAKIDDAGALSRVYTRACKDCRAITEDRLRPGG